MVVGQNRYPIDADDYITNLQSPVPTSQAPREDVFILQMVVRPVPSNNGEAKARGGLGEAGGDGLSLQLCLQLLVGIDLLKHVLIKISDFMTTMKLGPGRKWTTTMIERKEKKEIPLEKEPRIFHCQ